MEVGAWKGWHLTKRTIGLPPTKPVLSGQGQRQGEPQWSASLPGSYSGNVA